MTTTREIRDLIAEQTASPAERKALEGVSERLDAALSQDVPYRPEFKAELRRKLMAQARRQAPPAWYRRPAVWGSTAAVAAAVGILAVGLHFWSAPGTPSAPTPIAATQPGQAGDGHETTTTHVSAFPDLPRISLPDEARLPGQPGPESLAGIDLNQGLKVYLLVGRPGPDQLRKIAAGLKFAAPALETADGWSVTQGARSLRLAADGRVTYADATPAAANASLTDVNGALAAARQFLVDASLPIAGEPLVAEGSVGGQRRFRVTYTPRVEGRPVINLPTVITVSDRGAVLEADGYVKFLEEEKGRAREVLTDKEAVQLAGGRTFTGADLVYVRTQSRSGDWYLQPYWRAFSPDLIRYVPALK